MRVTSRGQPGAPPIRYRFANVEVVPQERQVRVTGASVAVGARAFDVLVTLLEHRDRVVSKNELLDIVWPGVVVEENNLQVQISSLRKLLGPDVIVTIPGRGYRCVGVVDADLGDAPDVAGAGVAKPAPAAVRAIPRQTNLPDQLLPLYGRAAEMARVRALLENRAAVSIVASSGVGKTRLAQAVAAGLCGAFADGAWCVELAAVTDGELVAAEVARVLGFQLAAGRPPLQTVVDVLRKQSLLLLLDNCEHLLAASGALVAAIVRDAPNVRVMVTSIAPLKIADEQVFRLGTLALPSTLDLADVEDSGAVQLFVDRVQAANPRFVLNAANADEVAAICHRLDGIPLALQLAAARVPLLGIDGLHAGLDERFRILTSSSRFVLRRHQTLRAALDFSHSLLTPDEQKVFRRIGVFAGSFAVESAQDVAADDQIDRWAVLDILGALVDKSMLQAEAGHQPRLRLLETARAYALEMLGDANETNVLLERHARAMAQVFADSHDAFWHTSDEDRFARHWPELDNLRAALGWALAHDTELAIGLCGNAGVMWVTLELQLEGARFCERALGGVTAATCALAHGRLWHALGWTLIWMRPGRSREAVARAAELLRKTDDTATLGMALLLNVLTSRKCDARQSALDEIRCLHRPDTPAAVRAQLANAGARVDLLAGRYAEARRQYVEGAALLRSAGKVHWQLAMQRSAGEVALLMGDSEIAAADLAETAGRLAVMHCKGIYLALALGSLAAALLFKGETHPARARLEEAAPAIIRFDLGPRFAATAALLAAQENRWLASAQLLGYGDADAVSRALANGEPMEAMVRERAVQRLAANASQNDIAAWQRAGALLSTEDAYRLALAAG